MKKFHPEINETFQSIRNKQIITAVFASVELVLQFTLLTRIQQVIDSVSLKDFQVTIGYLKDCGILLALFFLANCVMQYFFRDLQYTSHYLLMKSLFSKTLQKEYAYHEKHVPSVSLSMIKDDSKYIADWKSIGGLVAGFNILSLAASFGIMLYYNVLITLTIFMVIVGCFVVIHFISVIVGKKTYDLQEANAEVNQRIVDYLNGIKDIKQYRKEGFFGKRLSRFIDENTYKHSKSISRCEAVYTSVYMVLTMALPVLVVLAGVILILRGQYTIGELIATFALVGNLQEPVMVIPGFFNQRRQAIAMQEKLMPILEKEDKIYPNQKPGKLKKFTFHSDKYTFADGKEILQNVDFVLKQGDHAGVKGESGKGKTSLFNLISRFHSTKDQPVKMEYNGMPVDSIEPGAYYEHVLQAPQTPYIFRDTLHDNITLGEVYDEKSLAEVMETACLEELAEGKGMDYVLEQNGENISGGQRQRVGLARVLLRKPDILMLDEPTSALNAELIDTLTKNVIAYCKKYKISLMIISHNDSFTRWDEGQREICW